MYKNRATTDRVKMEKGKTMNDAGVMRLMRAIKGGMDKNDDRDPNVDPWDPTNRKERGKQFNARLLFTIIFKRETNRTFTEDEMEFLKDLLAYGEYKINHMNANEARIYEALKTY